MDLGTASSLSDLDRPGAGCERGEGQRPTHNNSASTGFERGWLPLGSGLTAESTWEGCLGLVLCGGSAHTSPSEVAAVVRSSAPGRLPLEVSTHTHQPSNPVGCPPGLSTWTALRQDAVPFQLSVTHDVEMLGSHVEFWQLALEAVGSFGLVSMEWSDLDVVRDVLVVLADRRWKRMGDPEFNQSSHALCSNGMSPEHEGRGAPCVGATNPLQREELHLETGPTPSSFEPPHSSSRLQVGRKQVSDGRDLSVITHQG